MVWGKALVTSEHNHQCNHQLKNALGAQSMSYEVFTINTTSQLMKVRKNHA